MSSQCFLKLGCGFDTPAIFRSGAKADQKKRKSGRVGEITPFTVTDVKASDDFFEMTDDESEVAKE